MEANNSPLALNSWVDMRGPNSYGAAISAIEDVMNHESDDSLRDNPALGDFVMKSLYDRIASQSQANYEQYLRVKGPLTDEQINHVQGEFIRGDKSPADLVLFLYATDPLNSIEIGRRTTRQWNIYDEVDYPIRKNLDEHPLLETEAIKSVPLYRIKNLNVVDRSDNYFVQVDRKRTIRQHFGGNVLTVVRNSLVLHNQDGTMPREIRQYIRDERDDALNRSNNRSNGDYDYDKHSEILHEYLEEHILNRKTSEKPAWAMPILTTYYAARASALRGRLLEFEDVAKQEIT